MRLGVVLLTFVAIGSSLLVSVIAMQMLWPQRFECGLKRWKLYHSRYGEFQLKFPDGWKIQEFPQLVDDRLPRIRLVVTLGEEKHQRNPGDFLFIQVQDHLVSMDQLFIRSQHPFANWQLATVWINGQQALQTNTNFGWGLTFQREINGYYRQYSFDFPPTPSTQKTQTRCSEWIWDNISRSITLI